MHRIPGPFWFVIRCTCRKILKVMDMAAKNGVPVIGVFRFRRSENIGRNCCGGKYSRYIKQTDGAFGCHSTITVVAGPCIGTAAYVAALSDFTLMVEGISAVALHGPQIYRSALGKNIQATQEFGARNHNEKYRHFAVLMCK